MPSENTTPPIVEPSTPGDTFETTQEAVSQVLNTDLASVPVEQLKEVFSNIEPSDLSDEQVEQKFNVKSLENFLE